MPVADHMPRTTPHRKTENATDPYDLTTVRTTTRSRRTDMSLMVEALSRARSADLEREAELQRVALSLHRAQRLQRRAERAQQRAEHASHRARLLLARAG